jgi:DNA-binding beta-propeller fold protein YncE
MFRILNGESKGPRLLGLLACAVLQATAVHAATITLNNNHAGAIAYDGGANCLYFLDGNALMRLQLTPECEAGTAACSPSTVVVSLPSRPVDVAVNSAAGLAYVTSAGGALWKVDLNSPTPMAIPVPVPPGLGAARLVLAPEINAAFVLAADGMLQRVDLSTGTAKFLAQVQGGKGFALNATRTFAYVSLLSGEGLYRGTLVEIDLATGKQTRTIVNLGLATTALSLAWTDSSERAFYALTGGVEGGNDIVRLDLMTSQVTLIARFTSPGGFDHSSPLNALAANPSGSGLYLGGHDSVARFPLSAVPDGKHVFISIGNIPAKDISAGGYADTSTDPAGLFRVVNAPFGGTLDIFGNLTLLREEYGANSYQIMIQSLGPGPTPLPVPLLASWTAHAWNPNPPLAHFEPRLVAPVNNAGVYTIPLEYISSATAPFLAPTYLMMRWPTSDNGLYRLTLKVFSDVSGTHEITSSIPAAQQALTVLIDNTPPVVVLNSIIAGGDAIKPCQIVMSPDPNVFEFDLTASDPNAHLLNYSLSALWGRNQSATILSGSFGLDATDFSPPHLLPSAGWAASCNCAHTFTLHATKRTIDGYNYILSASSSQSITIDNAPNSCP